MKYKDLKEMTLKDWNGEPFIAYVCDNDNEDFGCPLVTAKVYGYIANKTHPWYCDSVCYKHAYLVKWNREKGEESLKPKRMTKRQLAMWLAKGNGQWRYMDTDVIFIHTEFHYGVGVDDSEVKGNICVRKWGSDEWIEPTTDLLSNVE